LHFLGDQTRARHHIDRVLVHLEDFSVDTQIVRFRFDLRSRRTISMLRIFVVAGFADQALRLSSTM